MGRKRKNQQGNFNTATLLDGTILYYEPDPIGEGQDGIVYFVEGRKEVLKFFKNHAQNADPEIKIRIEKIVNVFNPTLDPESGKYWAELYRWPNDIVILPSLGVKIPTYQSNFFFKDKDKGEKILSWFISPIPKIRATVPDDERGTWLGHLQIAILMARATRRLHTAGLAHSDLSYKNFLADPAKGTLIMIDLDGLVVPGVHPPKVAGSPGLMAPEVVMGKAEPSIRTDLHTLAVLIYQTLLFRHPLKGPKVHAHNTDEDERLALGEKALFIEHPTDHSNRPKGIQNSYKILGPFLSSLIERSFITSLQDPNNRPTAIEWEQALVKSMDILVPCSNQKCEKKWFIMGDFHSSCPWCHTKIPYKTLPLLYFFKEQGGKKGHYIYEAQNMIVWNGRRVHKWHVYDNIWPGERVNKTEYGYFQYHQGEWYLVNTGMLGTIIANGFMSNFNPGSQIHLTLGLQIKLSNQDHGRLVQTHMIKIL